MGCKRVLLVSSNLWRLSPAGVIARSLASHLHLCDSHSVSCILLDYPAKAQLWQGIRIYSAMNDVHGEKELQGLVEYYYEFLHPHIVVGCVDNAYYENLYAIIRGLTQYDGVPSIIIRHDNQDSLFSADSIQKNYLLLGSKSLENNLNNHECPITISIENGMSPVSDTIEALCGLINATMSKRVYKVKERDYELYVNMKYDLFAGVSLSDTMTELSLALDDEGVGVKITDQGIFARKGFIREGDLIAKNDPRYQRILFLKNRWLPENESIHIDHTLADHNIPMRYKPFTIPGAINVLYDTGHARRTRNAAEFAKKYYDAVFVPSSLLYGQYMAFKLDQLRTFIIPHGVNEHVFKPEAKPVRLPTEEPFVFLQYSYPWPEKGFKTLLHAYFNEFTQKDDVCLIIKCPPVRSDSIDNIKNLEKELQESMNQSGRKGPDALLITGYTPYLERAGWYTACNCYVHPARAEGFGMTIIEAMACGLPVIASSHSNVGHTDFCTPFNSFLIESNRTSAVDIEHLQYLMRWVYENYEKAKLIGLSASDEIRTRWTWRESARKCIHAIRQIKSG